jgi:hypothetical protein
MPAMRARALDIARQAALFVAAYYLYRLVRGAVDDPQSAAIAFENARRIIEVERSLGLFREPAIQGWAREVGWLEQFSVWMYINAQTTITVGGLAWIWLRHRDSFSFVRNMFLIAFALACAGYMLYPTAPPRFMPEWGFVDSVALTTGVGHDSQVVNALFNPYAAVPSMHVGFAIMVGLPLARLVRSPVLRAAWALYPLLVTFVIVATANHFIADAVLGAAVVAVAAAAARALAAARPHAWAFAPRPA